MTGPAGWPAKVWGEAEFLAGKSNKLALKNVPPKIRANMTRLVGKRADFCTHDSVIRIYDTGPSAQ